MKQQVFSFVKNVFFYILVLLGIILIIVLLFFLYSHWNTPNLSTNEDIHPLLEKIENNESMFEESNTVPWEIEEVQHFDALFEEFKKEEGKHQKSIQE